MKTSVGEGGILVVRKVSQKAMLRDFDLMFVYQGISLSGSVSDTDTGGMGNNRFHTPLCQENTGNFFLKFFFLFLGQSQDHEGPVTSIKCWVALATASASCPHWLATASQARGAFLYNLLVVAIDI